MQTTIEIGNKIAVARKLQNLSQADLAMQMSITSQAVGKWERGESMPDIITFDRLAEVLDVDLNYFSGNENGREDKSIHAAATQESDITGTGVQAAGARAEEKNRSTNWDMSKGNWADADFSGLSGLGDKFSSSNILRCNFVNSDLSALALKSNNVQNTDFSESNLSGSKFAKCNLSASQFTGCDLTGAEFSYTNISKCDFGNANFTDVVFLRSNFDSPNLTGATWLRTVFRQSGLQNVIFSGEMTDCAIEGIGKPARIAFRNITLRNTFFKNCDLRKATFENCSADNITLAFLKSSRANVEGIALL